MGVSIAAKRSRLIARLHASTLVLVIGIAAIEHYEK
jgi:hypothetical protein